MSNSFSSISLLGAGVFGDCLGTFWYSVLSQLTGQQETNSSLNLPTGDCWSLVVVSQSWWFWCNTFKDVIDETVHDWHCFGWDSSIRMYLLQHFVDVDSVRFLPTCLPFLLLISLGDIFHCFFVPFWCHFNLISRCVIHKSSLKNDFYALCARIYRGIWRESTLTHTKVRQKKV